jgi:hypothetical protein
VAALSADNCETDCSNVAGEDEVGEAVAVGGSEGLGAAAIALNLSEISAISAHQTFQDPWPLLRVFTGHHRTDGSTRNAAGEIR